MASLMPANSQEPIAKPIRRVLILKFGGMGEALLARSLVEHLRQRHSDMTFDFLVEKRTLETMKCGSDGNVLIYAPRTDGAGRALSILRQIRRRRYDAVIDFEQCSMLTAAFARATSIPYRIGFIPADGGPRTRFFTHGVTLREENSMWKGFLQLGRMLDPSLPESLSTVPLPYSDELQRWRNEWWRTNLGQQAGPVVALHLGVGPSAQYRRWPLECFSELAARLTRNGGAVVLTGAKDEETLISDFKKMFRGPVVEAVNLDQLAHTAAILERCDLLVSNDTGVMHLGAAMGTPTVGLYGASNPAWWAPVGSRSTYVYETSQICSPCINSYQRHIPKSCTAPVEGACMRDIRVEDVLQAARRVVRTGWLDSIKVDTGVMVSLQS